MALPMLAVALQRLTPESVSFAWVPSFAMMPLNENVLGTPTGSAGIGKFLDRQCERAIATDHVCPENTLRLMLPLSLATTVE
jgi:hypothetical protein